MSIIHRKIPPHPTSCNKHSYYHRDCEMCKAIIKRYMIWKRTQETRRKEIVEEMGYRYPPGNGQKILPWWIKKEKKEGR